MVGSRLGVLRLALTVGDCGAGLGGVGSTDVEGVAKVGVGRASFVRVFLPPLLNVKSPISLSYTIQGQQLALRNLSLSLAMVGCVHTFFRPFPAGYVALFVLRIFQQIRTCIDHF